MTALTKYERLESPGIWRASPEDQRLNSIVSLGDATLTISDMHDRALAHWSLPAIHRLNPGERPALFAPATDSSEELELEDDRMIRAIEKVRRVIARRRPHHGRLRQFLVGGAVAAVAALAVFWLPGALVSYTVTVVPAPVRAAVGQHLLDRIYHVSGQRCADDLGRAALGRLGSRVLGPGKAELVVLAGGVTDAAHLPGGITLLSQTLIDGQDGPEVAAGFILAEAARKAQTDPLERLLQEAGFVATFKLLTTGSLPETALDRHARTLLTTPPEPVGIDALLARFAVARLRSTPYAYALDPSGETTLALIEADPVPLSHAEPVLSDGDWVSLQGICGE